MAETTENAGVSSLNVSARQAGIMWGALSLILLLLRIAGFVSTTALAAGILGLIAGFIFLLRMKGTARWVAVILFAGWILIFLIVMPTYTAMYPETTDATKRARVHEDAMRAENKRVAIDNLIQQYLAECDEIETLSSGKIGQQLTDRRIKTRLKIIAATSPEAVATIHNDLKKGEAEYITAMKAVKDSRLLCRETALSLAKKQKGEIKSTKPLALAWEQKFSFKPLWPLTEWQLASLFFLPLLVYGSGMRLASRDTYVQNTIGGVILGLVAIMALVALVPIIEQLLLNDWKGGGLAGVTRTITPFQWFITGTATLTLLVIAMVFSSAQSRRDRNTQNDIPQQGREEPPSTGGTSNRSVGKFFVGTITLLAGLVIAYIAGVYLAETEISTWLTWLSGAPPEYSQWVTTGVASLILAILWLIITRPEKRNT